MDTRRSARGEGLDERRGAGRNGRLAFCDPSIDRIADALALEARSPQQAGDAWAQVDRALTDAVPQVPLVIDGSAVLLSPRVRHYEVDFSGPLFDQLWVT